MSRSPLVDADKSSHENERAADGGNDSPTKSGPGAPNLAQNDGPSATASSPPLETALLSPPRTPNTGSPLTVKAGVTTHAELDGIDWSKMRRRNHLKRGSMPNVLSAPASPIPPAGSLRGSFTRTASSAEDDAVGAIRTRVMNASFSRRQRAAAAARSLFPRMAIAPLASAPRRRRPLNFANSLGSLSPLTTDVQ